MDFYAKKYTVLMGNEPIELWIKNGMIKKSSFMEKAVHLNFDDEAIKSITSTPAKIINAEQLKNNESFKYQTSKMLSTKLDLAIAKNDHKTMSRFARSELVPEDMKDNFLEAVNAPRGIRKILNNAVNKTNLIFHSLAKKVDRFFDKLNDKVTNKTLDKYLDEYQLKEFNKAPPLESLGNLKDIYLDPKLSELASNFIKENQIKNLNDTDIKDKNLQNIFYAATAGEFSLIEAKQALFKTLSQNQNQEQIQTQAKELNAGAVLNQELHNQIEALKKQIAVFEQAQMISNTSFDNFEKLTQGMTQSEKIDVLVENEEYLALDEEEKYHVEEKYIFSPEIEKMELQEKGEEIGALAAALKNHLLSKTEKEEAEQRATDILGENKHKYVAADGSLDTQKLEEASAKAAIIVKSQQAQTQTQPAPKLKFTQQELDVLKQETTAELRAQDPRGVLNDLGIEYKEIGNDSYQMNLRGEKTASAYITLKNGTWKYKDFGTDKSGDIVNVVMDYTGKDFKSSFSYSLDRLGVENRLETALNKKPISSSQDFKANLAAKQESNKERETSAAMSKVTSTHEVSTNKMAVDYLAARGITKIPPMMKIINGEYTSNKTGEQKKAYGVGVMTHDGKGADIHFLKKIGDLKTMSFGNKQPSFYKNEMSDKAIVFESKMDYAAAYQQQNIHAENVFIANGVANAKVIGTLIKENNLTSIEFYNQNDRAGYEFVANVAKEAGITDFQALKYDVIGEYKKDINDLLISGETNISARFQPQTIQGFEAISKTLDNFEKSQKDILSQTIQHEQTKEQMKAENQNQEQER